MLLCLLHCATWQDVLSKGQGALSRVAESGQLVLDRVKHADVLEYLWLLTRWGPESAAVGCMEVVGELGTGGPSPRFALAYFNTNSPSCSLLRCHLIGTIYWDYAF